MSPFKTADERWGDKVFFDTAGGGCWLWMAAVGRNGYGVFWDGNRLVYAHRASYEMHKRKIPVGLQVDHLCNVRLCVRPDHLRTVTPRENSFAKHSNSTVRVNSEKTHCPRNHPLRGANLLAGRYRTCRTCKQARDAVRRSRLRQGGANVDS